METPEHVVFDHLVAGPATRAQAWLLDLLGEAVVLLVAAFVLTRVFGFTGLVGAQTGVQLLVLFAVDWGWFTLTEGLFGGQSPGKRALGLRVVREDGGGIGWREAILRNLLRPADAAPVGYVVGVVAMGLDPRFQRLGDRLAGTLVVRHRRVLPGERGSVRPAEPYEAARLPRRVDASVPVRRALEEWAAARPRMGERWAEVIATRVADRLGDRHGIPQAEPVRRMELLLLASRASEAEAERSVGTRRVVWSRFADDVTFAELHPPDGALAARLVGGYRALCADLGRLRQTGVRPDTLEELHGLCARAHDRIYERVDRGGAPSWRRVVHHVLVELPAEVRAQRLYVELSALLFLGSFLVGFVLAGIDPDFTRAVLPAAERRQIEASYRDAIARTGDENAQMAGFYVWNNVGIALRSIAAGTFAGLGTAWVLLYNGLETGAVAGHLQAVGSGLNLLRFVCGHSPWELTALIIAGGGGLRLGTAMVLRGGRTLNASLREAGPSVVRIATTSALMLLVAATIEGFWSGSELPDLARWVFAGTQVVLVTAWLGGRLRG